MCGYEPAITALDFLGCFVYLCSPMHQMTRMECEKQVKYEKRKEILHICLAGISQIHLQL